MSDDLCLLYRRHPKTRSCSGQIGIGSPALRATGSDVLDRFEDISFEDMIDRLAEEARRHPAANVVMQRTDREGLVPHTLDASTAALLRDDTPGFLTVMNVVVQMPDDHPRAPLPPILVVGHDVLADAFGEQLYCRRRRNEIECPVCGRWTKLVLFQGFNCCKYCETVLPVELVNDRWAAIEAEDLLKLTASRFFFPRAWNGGRNWITHEALKNKYDTYLQEKNAS